MANYVILSQHGPSRDWLSCSFDCRFFQAPRTELPVASSSPNPDFVIFDMPSEQMNCLELAQRWRAFGDWSALTPMFAVGEPPDTGMVSDAAEIDDYLPERLTNAEVDAKLSAWHLDDLSGLDRLTNVFGSSQIRPLGIGLRDLLIDALHTPSNLISDGFAHRIAGLSGTLGFRNLSAAWSDVELGRSSAVEIRSITRKAIFCLTKSLNLPSEPYELAYRELPKSME